jgi:hypothetical protein
MAAYDTNEIRNHEPLGGGMNEAELIPEAETMFSELGDRPLFRSNAGMNPAGYRELFERVARTVLNPAGVKLVPYTQYLWYASELARVFRKSSAGNLALELKLVMQKWVGYGVDARLLQQIMCACYRELKTRACNVDAGQPGKTEVKNDTAIE